MSKKLKKQEKQIAKAVAVADAVRSVSKQNASSSSSKPKKKKTSFWSVVGGAAKMAAQLAPTVLPLLLGPNGHAPTMQATSTLPPGSIPAAPMAIGSATQATGMYSLKASRGRDGRVSSVRVSGMDYIGDLAGNGETAGTVLRDIDLNPNSSDWLGTSLQQQAGLFERYRPIRVCCMVEPACPSTTAGQLLSYIDPDPDDEDPPAGKTGLQMASSHEGADISQVWQINMTSLAFDATTQDFYSSYSGSDARLISPGTWRIMANSTMPTAPIGTLYVIWEYEFRIPQLEGAGGRLVFLNAGLTTGVTAVIPFGTGTWESISSSSSSAPAKYAGLNTTDAGPAGAGSYFYSLPPACYLVVVEFQGGTVVTPSVVAVGNYLNAVTNVAGTIAPIGTAYSTGAGWIGYFMLNVQNLTENLSDGSLFLTVASGTFTESSIYFCAIPNPYADLLGLRGLSLQQFQKRVLRELKELRDLHSSTSSAAHAANPPPLRTTSLMRMIQK